MNAEDVKSRIWKLLEETDELIPIESIDDLDSTECLPDIPQWHVFEREIWNRGEMIRQLFKRNKNLLKDKKILEKIVSISLSRNAKRGRQPFVIILCHRNCIPQVSKLVSQLDDKFICGDIIEGLNKIQLPGYASIVRPFCFDKVNWIKKQANKYVEWEIKYLENGKKKQEKLIYNLQLHHNL